SYSRAAGWLGQARDAASRQSPLSPFPRKGGVFFILRTPSPNPLPSGKGEQSHAMQRASFVLGGGARRAPTAGRLRGLGGGGALRLPEGRGGWGVGSGRRLVG